MDRQEFGERKRDGEILVYDKESQANVSQWRKSGGTEYEEQFRRLARKMLQKTADKPKGLKEGKGHGGKCSGKA